MPHEGGLAGASDRGDGSTWAGWESRGAVERDPRWRHGINGPCIAGTSQAHGHGKAHGERACKGTRDFLSPCRWTREHRRRRVAWLVAVLNKRAREAKIALFFS